MKVCAENRHLRQAANRFASQKDFKTVSNAQIIILVVEVVPKLIQLQSHDQ